MFPFWEPIIRPLIRAIDPQHVVEIGALRGDSTERLLSTLQRTAELHVIDPAPQFDPDEHATRFAGRYVFHQDISHNVLPGLAPTDLALIDGDHNWYTVYNELQLLWPERVRAELPMPVLVLHDVCWPYGRRDGYYAPERIPAAFRHPCAHLGLQRGHDALLDQGGTNRSICNARHEGGARNGVLTALEDFVREQVHPLTYVTIQLYAGLAIAVDQRQLATDPALAALWTGIGSADTLPKIKVQCDAAVRDAIAAGELTLG